MRNIDSNILAELAKAEFRPFYLLDIEIESTHYRYTDCDVPIVFDGNIYAPLGFSIGGIKYSSQTIVDSLELVIENLDSVMTSLFVGGTPQGSAVTLKVVLIMADGSIYYMPVSTEGLVGYWPLDEGSGSTAKDKSGNGNDGTLVNMEEADWVDGVVGKCLDFDGVDGNNNYVNCGTFAVSGAFSMMARVTPDNVTGVRGIIGNLYHPAPCYGTSLHGYGTSVAIVAGDGRGNRPTHTWASILEIGQTYFLVAVYDGTKFILYVNGEKQAYEWTATVAQNDTTWIIGQWASTYLSHYIFDGKIDEPRIYNRALTAHEITALYNLAYGSATLFEGTIDTWNLDEEQCAITVTSLLSQWAQKTLAKHSASCRWKVFKGTNLSLNGAFDSDTDWTKGTGWSIAAGVAHCDGTQAVNSWINQDAGIVSGKTYRISWTVSNYSAGTFWAQVGNVPCGSKSANGTYNETITTTAAAVNVYIAGNVDFIGDIDDVFVYDIAINQCLYAGGETWCDRTYARCLVLGNTDNFGGFRWLPSIIDKEIWWGRLRGEPPGATPFHPKAF